jgi:hypothetical protein
MKIKRMRLNKIKGGLNKLPETLGERAFLTFLGLLTIFLIFGALLFYKYIFLTERARPEVTEKPLQLNEALFKEILKKFEERERKFKETEAKQYPDPFTRTIPVGEEESELTE